VNPGNQMKDQLKQAVIDGNETVALAVTQALLASGASVMVGGAPVTAAHAEEIGSDGYGANAGMAVERAKELVG
jgi:hypothetical protein